MMSAGNDPLARILTRLRAVGRRVRWMRAARLAARLAALGAVAAVAVVVASRFVAVPELAWAAAVPVAIGAIAGAAAGLARSLPLEAVAAIADRHAGLDERVATAVELARASPSPSPFLEAVLRQAEDALAGVRASEVVPAAVPRASLLALGGAGLAFALSFLPSVGPDGAAPAGAKEVAALAPSDARALELAAKELGRAARAAMDPEAERIARAMEALAKGLAPDPRVGTRTEEEPRPTKVEALARLGEQKDALDRELAASDARGEARDALAGSELTRDLVRAAAEAAAADAEARAAAKALGEAEARAQAPPHPDPLPAAEREGADSEARAEAAAREEEAARADSETRGDAQARVEALAREAARLAERLLDPALTPALSPGEREMAEKLLERLAKMDLSDPELAEAAKRALEALAGKVDPRELAQALERLATEAAKRLDGTVDGKVGRQDLADARRALAEAQRRIAGGASRDGEAGPQAGEKCGACDGAGCESCGGSGRVAAALAKSTPDARGDGSRAGVGSTDRGTETGQPAGPRETAEGRLSERTPDETGTYRRIYAPRATAVAGKDETTPFAVGEGRALAESTVEGPPVPAEEAYVPYGDVPQAYRQAAEEALDAQAIPREYRDHVRTYFGED